jgi:hypothetical protein
LLLNIRTYRWSGAAPDLAFTLRVIRAADARSCR